MSLDRSFAITGGAGFIGSHLVDQLLDRGARRVFVIDDLSSGSLENLAHRKGDSRLEVVEADCGSDIGLRAVAEAEAVVHLAATKHYQSVQDPVGLVHTNVDATLRVIEAAREGAASQLLFASSLYVYGTDRKGPFSESSPLTSRTIYGASKIAGEYFCRAAGRDAGLDVVSLRYFFIYGPRLYRKNYANSLVPRSIRRALQGEPPEIYGDGQQAFDYLYVDDAVELTIRALQASSCPDVLNVCSGSSVTVNEVVDKLIRLTGFSGTPIYGPPDDSAGTVRTGDPSEWQRALGPHPLVNLEEGLERSLAWWRTSAQAQRA